MRVPQRVLLFIASAFVLMSLTACGNILDSSALYADHSQACRVSTGAYYLPKRLLTVTVTSDDNKSYDIALDDKYTAVPDVNFLFCLDYLSSSFAEDYVGIDRTPSGLLRRVFTKAIDKSDEIAIKVIDALGTGAAAVDAARSRNFPKQGDKWVVSQFTFDPFDFESLDRINSALARVGFCVFLDPHNDPFVPPWSGANCLGRFKSKPSWEPAIYPTVAQRRGGSLKDANFAAEPVRLEARDGILYRPNLTHGFVILRRQDPTSGEPWELYKKSRIEIPNAAPIFSVKVERSLFVERQTDLQFSEGVLMDVAIKKDSELAAFAEIPLVAAQVVVNVPTQVLKIRLNTANNEAAVIAANTKLLETINDIDAANQAARSAAPPPTTSAVPNATPRYQQEARAKTSADDDFIAQRFLEDCTRKSEDNIAARDRCMATAQQCRQDGTTPLEQCLHKGEDVITQ